MPEKTDDNEDRQALISSDINGISCTDGCFRISCGVIAFLVIGGIIAGIVAAISSALEGEDGSQCSVLTSYLPLTELDPSGCIFTKYGGWNCESQPFGCENTSVMADIPLDGFVRVATSLLYQDYSIYCVAQNPCGEWQQFNESHFTSICDVVVDCLNGTNKTVAVTLRTSDSARRKLQTASNKALLKQSLLNSKRAPSTDTAIPRAQQP